MVFNPNQAPKTGVNSREENNYWENANEPNKMIRNEALKILEESGKKAAIDYVVSLSGKYSMDRDDSLEPFLTRLHNEIQIKAIDKSTKK